MRYLLRKNDTEIEATHEGDTIVKIIDNEGRELRVIIYKNGGLRIMADDSIKWAKDSNIEAIKKTLKLANLSKIYGERQHLESWCYPV